MSFSRLKLHRHLELIFTGGECRPSLERGRKILTDWELPARLALRARDLSTFRSLPPTIQDLFWVLVIYWGLLWEEILSLNVMRKGNLPTLKLFLIPQYVWKWKYSVNAIRKHILTCYLYLLGLSNTFSFQALKTVSMPKCFCCLRKN